MPADPNDLPGDMNADFQQILAHYNQSVDAQLQTVKHTLRTEIIPALVVAGVANIQAAFSGYGDSGTIDGPEGYPSVAFLGSTS